LAVLTETYFTGLAIIQSHEKTTLHEVAKERGFPSTI